MMIANFPKSTAEKPALFKHEDVETFFHEFGHGIHELLSNVEMNSFAGIFFLYFYIVKFIF